MSDMKGSEKAGRRRQKAEGRTQKAEGRTQRAEGSLNQCSKMTATVVRHKYNSPLIRGCFVLGLRLNPFGDKGGCLHGVVTLFIILFIGSVFNPVYAQNSVHLQGTAPNLSQQMQVEALYPELQQYIQIAIEQNPELQSLQAGVEADRERVRESGVLMDPEISVAYDFNPVMSDSYLGRFSVSAMQMFPWFGTLEARRDLQRSAADVTLAQISSRQLEILRDLQLTWFDIAEMREQIHIAEQTLELVRDLEKLVKTRYETGRAGQADILRIQMEEQRLKNRIADLEDRINPLAARFNELLNRDAKTEVDTTDELLHAELVWSDEETREQIRRLNPVFDGIKAERSAAENEYRLAELDGRPGFGIGIEVMGRDFGPMSMFPDARESIIGMATIRVPLFRSRYNSQKQQAHHRIRSLDLREHQTENRLMADLEEFLEEIRRSERMSILLSDELVPRAEQALSILSEEYSVGSARFDELLQIQRELLNLEFERIEAITNQNRAVIKIKTLMGITIPH